MSHPLEKFIFCPVCGSNDFNVSSFKSKKCKKCGLELFMNPSSACVAIVEDNGKLLVVKRKLPPAEGTLDLPGGFADIGETAEQSVQRELLEETGLRAKTVEYLFSEPNLYHFSGIEIPTQDLFFLCKVDNVQQAEASDDAAECIWCPIKQLDPELFGLQSIQRGVKRYLSCYDSSHKQACDEDLFCP